MDNAAYFFSGVLAGVAGITLLAMVDNKYGLFTDTKVTVTTDDTGNVLKIEKTIDDNKINNEAVDDKDNGNDNPITPPTVVAA